MQTYGAILLDERAAAPASPAAGKQAFYAKTDGYLYGKTSAGTEVAYRPTTHTGGTFAARGSAANLKDGSTYFATDDDGGTLYQALAGAWSQVAPGATEASGVELARMEIAPAGGIIQSSTTTTLADVVYLAANFAITFATGAKPAIIRYVGVGNNSTAGSGGRIAVTNVASTIFEDTIGDSGSANAYFPIIIEVKIPANTASNTYRVQIARRTAGTFNLAGLPGRSAKLYAVTC